MESEKCAFVQLKCAFFVLATTVLFLFPALTGPLRPIAAWERQQSVGLVCLTLNDDGDNDHELLEEISFSYPFTIHQ